jgi:hypothetical protein
MIALLIAFMAMAAPGFAETQKVTVEYRGRTCSTEALMGRGPQVYVSLEALRQLFAFSASRDSTGALLLNGRSVSVYTEGGRDFVNADDFAGALGLGVSYKIRVRKIVFSDPPSKSGTGASSQGSTGSSSSGGAGSSSQAGTGASSGASGKSAAGSVSITITVKSHATAKVSDPVNDTSHTYVLVLLSRGEQPVQVQSRNILLATDKGTTFTPIKLRAWGRDSDRYLERSFSLEPGTPKEIELSWNLPQNAIPAEISITVRNVRAGVIKL